MESINLNKKLCFFAFFLTVVVFLALSMESMSAGPVDRAMAAGFQEYHAFIPVVMKNWPPMPTTPSLNAIDNWDQDNYYTVTWQNTGTGGSYILQQSTDSSFSNPALVYQGTGTAWSVPTPGQFPATYYYRVASMNPYGQSDWTATQSVTIYPLFVGLKVRWDGVGYVRGSKYYDIGTHWTNHVDLLVDANTIRSNGQFWYDPNPLGFESESWYSYYSVTTGAWKATSLPEDPSWKWGYSWKLSYDSKYSNDQTVTIDGQAFTVTGPHQGYTTYGKPISYWKFVNQKKFLFWDGGGDWKQYVHGGDIVMRYDAGNSKLLIYSNIMRRFYYQGDYTSDTVQYFDNLTAASSLPGSPPVETDFEAVPSELQYNVQIPCQLCRTAPVH